MPPKAPVPSYFDPNQTFRADQTIKSFVDYIAPKCVSLSSRTIRLQQGRSFFNFGRFEIAVSLNETASKYLSKACVVILSGELPKKYKQTLKGAKAFSDKIRAIQAEYNLPTEPKAQFNTAEVQEGLTIDSFTCEVVYFPIGFLADYCKGKNPVFLTSLKEAFTCLKPKASDALLARQAEENTSESESEAQAQGCCARLFSCRR